MKIRAILLLIASCGLLVLSACGDEGNPSEVGNACETDDDCETGNCYVGPGGGYCTTSCDSEGSTDQCPEDTVCKPIQGGPARCLLVCGSESACDDNGECGENECPSGSSCVDISDTDLRACEPDPN
ncbi:MAG: hypothetical protein ACQEVA_15940 [Myxococcota bacterium]